MTTIGLTGPRDIIDHALQVGRRDGMTVVTVNLAEFKAAVAEFVALGPVHDCRGQRMRVGMLECPLAGTWRVARPGPPSLSLSAEQAARGTVMPGEATDAKAPAPRRWLTVLGEWP